MNTIEEMKVYAKERNEALLSLDREKILAFGEKWGVALPDDELIFWATVHKCIYHTASAIDEQRANSEAWLKLYGFTTDIY